ncbi:MULTISPECIES: hypothetical protein [unclassified Pseudomonas]|uniref:hypothetical protein n=1 Tax=unclassified Pseudomonas TaxID=196821 RepID=UPI00244BEDF1|nr:MULTISPECIES: hypothetical protein [unclassified Pseudomonas]MDG9926649.1 hypothetical protein [Pseudomonas sp. GD04042]MDH0482282.1 hypothetical protein [Pseudomonas sp. GD04015]MDH0603717.1 hypothetical protein [Pseudomonas sp. GD03869]
MSKKPSVEEFLNAPGVRYTDLCFSCANDNPDLVKAIADRTNTPSIISQGLTPLCGPAAFMYCVAKHHKEVYKRYVVELLLHGEAKLGQLHVKPSLACRNGSAKKINPVDWVALASLRDSSNGLLSMSSGGSNMAGITAAGQMVEWFESCGLFSGADSKVNYVFGGSAKTLMEANQHHGSGSLVCLLIRAAILGPVAGTLPLDKLKKGTPKTFLGTPDHWIVLGSPIRVGRDSWTPSSYGSEKFLNSLLEFECYTWGDGNHRSSHRIANLTVRQFLPYFYGYVHVVL